MNYLASITPVAEGPFGGAGPIRSAPNALRPDTPVAVELLIALLGIGGTLAAGYLSQRQNLKAQREQREHDAEQRAADRLEGRLSRLHADRVAAYQQVGRAFLVSQRAVDDLQEKYGRWRYVASVAAMELKFYEDAAAKVETAFDVMSESITNVEDALADLQAIGSRAVHDAAHDMVSALKDLVLAGRELAKWENGEAVAGPHEARKYAAAEKAVRDARRSLRAAMVLELGIEA